ncbi:hypothetical protein MPSEU_000754500 [Mayamaea pseudoterrestris]|nr:hypothetical protein MPSEU_000754500 [Mayamaea pseudoterrestris]
MSSSASSLLDGSSKCLAVNQLQNPSLLSSFHQDSSSSSNCFPVTNPARPNEIVGYAPAHSKHDAAKMIQTAHDSLKSWRDETTAMHRSQLLQEWSRLIQEHTSDIGRIMTLESGKPIKESFGEVQYAKSYVDYFSAEAIRPSGAGGGYLVPTPFTTTNSDGATSTVPRGTIMALHQAIGLCGLIAPWNFPAAMILRKVAPALAAGCSCVVKPASQTPLTAMALVNLAYQAGIPKDVLQLVTCDTDTTKDIGSELTTNPLVRKVSFTGSTNVGKMLLQQCANTCKRTSMELGGNAPFVVFGDANLDQAVMAAMASKFRNAGQTCVCSDRFIVHASVHDDFCERLVQAIRDTINVGDGMDENTTMGPLISSQALQKVHERVQAAIDDGAKCLLGGEALPDLGPNFYAPTVLTNVSSDSDIFREETFGPVIAIVKFDTDEEALRLANDSNVGLAGYFCTENLARAFSFARTLECGIVGVNEGIVSTVVAPFGGVKESGMGREGSSMGMAEYLETKYIFMNA